MEGSAIAKPRLSALFYYDGAKYHKTYLADIPKVSKLRKTGTRSFLNRKGVAYASTDTVAILHAKAREYIELHEKRECEALAEEQGHKVLWTPPYYSDFQPIKLLWARIRGEVGCQYDNKSTLALVYERLIKAFERVDTKEGQASIERIIRASAKIAEEFYKKIQAEQMPVDGAEDDDDDSDGEDDPEDAAKDASDDEDPAEEDKDDQRQGASDAEASYGEEGYKKV